MQQEAPWWAATLAAARCRSNFDHSRHRLARYWRAGRCSLDRALQLQGLASYDNRAVKLETHWQNLISMVDKTPSHQLFEELYEL